jgi:YhcG PDDEXK nuclease domain
MTQVKAPEDQPTIGLPLRKEKNRLVAEYALRGVAKPMGMAEYQLMREVPPSLETGLPTIDQIEAELRPDLPDGTAETSSCKPTPRSPADASAED